MVKFLGRALFIGAGIRGGHFTWGDLKAEWVFGETRVLRMLLDTLGGWPIFAGHIFCHGVRQRPFTKVGKGSNSRG